VSLFRLFIWPCLSDLPWKSSINGTRFTCNKPIRDVRSKGGGWVNQYGRPRTGGGVGYPPDVPNWPSGLQYIFHFGRYCARYDLEVLGGGGRGLPNRRCWTGGGGGCKSQFLLGRLCMDDPLVFPPHPIIKTIDLHKLCLKQTVIPYIYM